MLTYLEIEAINASSQPFLSTLSLPSEEADQAHGRHLFANRSSAQGLGKNIPTVYFVTGTLKVSIRSFSSGAYF